VATHFCAELRWGKAEGGAIPCLRSEHGAPGTRLCADTPTPPYSVVKFLILMDLANRWCAKFLKALEFSAESSQERTYCVSVEEPSAPPSFSPIQLCMKTRKYSAKFSSSRAIHWVGLPSSDEGALCRGARALTV
jgi:hypothetical protein